MGDKVLWFATVLMLLVAVAYVATGCQTTTNPDTGQRVTQVNPQIGEKVDSAIKTAQNVGKAVEPLVPPPWRWVLELAGLAGLIWQTVRKAKITRGARAAAQVIDKHLKAPGGAAWAAARETLLAAEAKGAVNPDKLI